MSRSNIIRRPILALSCGILFGGAAAAQTPYATVFGTKAQDRLGAAVASAGDLYLPLDGSQEFIVGVPEDGDVFALGNGFIQICDGATGNVVDTYHGAATDGSFGYSVSGGLDIDGGGMPDFVVGAPFTSGIIGASGRVSVISAESKAEHLSIFGFTSNETLGRRVLVVRDQSGDGLADIVASSWSASTNKGVVRLFRGSDGMLMQSWQGSQNGARLGTSLAEISDINVIPDLFSDIVVGSAFDGYYVFSGSSAIPLRNTTAAQVGAGVSFGLTVATIQDHTGDMIEEIVIGEPQGDIFNPGKGRVWVRDGKSGAPRFTTDGATVGDGFGSVLSRAGDWDGDGKEDFVVTSNPLGSEPFVTFHSGTTGVQIPGTLMGDLPTDDFGRSLASLGDLGGDGKVEVIIGAPAADVNFVNDGYARIYTGPGGVPANSGASDCDCSSGNSPCANVSGADRGCPNSNANGLGALLVGNGNASIGGDTFSLSVTDAAPSKPGLILSGTASHGPNGLSTVPESAGLLCVTGMTRRGEVVMTSAAGTASFPDFQGALYGASDIVTAGSPVYYTYWFRDPGTASGCTTDGPGSDFNFSNGWRVTWQN